MTKTHEVNLYTSQFNKLKSYNFLILKDEDYKVQDYILFREVETMNEETTETGFHSMTRISEVIKDEGLKDGYVALILVKLA